MGGFNLYSRLCPLGADGTCVDEALILEPLRVIGWMKYHLKNIYSVLPK